MPDAISNAIRDAGGDLVNVDSFYADYLQTCRRLGITPTPPERAKELVAAWSAMFAAASAALH